jgi:Sec-independent protein translocase protein TatA
MMVMMVVVMMVLGPRYKLPDYGRKIITMVMVMMMVGVG